MSNEGPDPFLRTHNKEFWRYSSTEELHRFQTKFDTKLGLNGLKFFFKYPNQRYGISIVLRKCVN